MSKKINYYGTILTDEFYLLPEPDDHLALPLIKTPVVISDKSEIIDWTFATQAEFLDDLFAWGGIVHIRRYGTGTQWGFPFGHALAAVHYRKNYTGKTAWSKYQ